MIVKKMHELSIIDYDLDVCSLDLIDKIMYNKATNIIYFTRNHALYGYISLNMILSVNVDAGEIQINTNINFIRNNDLNWYKKLRKYRSISSPKNEVPIVDQEQRLIGAYCFDDEDIDFCKRNIRILDFVNNYFKEQLILVSPKNNTSYNIFNLFKCKLQKNSERFILSDFDCEISDPNKTKVVMLFADSYERNIYNYNKRYNEHRVELKEFTYREFIEYLLNNYKKDAFIESLDGVKIYTFNFKITQNMKKSTYIKNYISTMKCRKTICSGKNSTIPDELKNKFLDDLFSDEYWDLFKDKKYEQYKKDGITYLKDFSSEYINIKNGERVVLYQNKDYNNIVFFIGTCVFVGSRVEDKNTIPSIVQKMVNDEGLKYNVVNKSSWDDVNGRIWKILNTKMKKGDIVVIHEIGKLKNCTNINATRIAYNNKMPFDWFTDTFPHANHHATAIWAESIFNVIKNDMSKTHEIVDRDSLEDVQSRKIYIKKFYIDRYFKEIDLNSFNTVGSIVMNCNPFTKGHRYLVEQAKTYVDFLIIFVVEEDRSFFAYEDRIKMVENGVSDIDNVFVVPSGDFILSSSTFPEYFIKIMDSDIVNNVEFDINLFAECIASNLNITHRFVGQELSDKVTNEYNKAMHKILPKYGIKVVEIPRVQFLDNPISASLARKYLESNSYEKLYDILPLSTLDYLNINVENNINIGNNMEIIDSYNDDCTLYHDNGFFKKLGRVVNTLKSQFNKIGLFR